MKYKIKNMYDFAIQLIQLDFNKKFNKELSSVLYEKFYYSLPPEFQEGIQFKSGIESYIPTKGDF
jgi:hypothetical protein